MFKIFKKLICVNPLNLCHLCAIFLFISNYAHSQSVYVPLNHWVYNYLEKLETKKIIYGALNGSKPLSREEISDYLVVIHKQANQLNKVEQEQLNFLNIEFKEELSNRVNNLTITHSRIEKIRSNKYIRKFIPRFIYQNNRNLYNWEYDKFQVFVDPVLYHHRHYTDTDSSSKTEKVFQLTNGICIWGNLGDHLGFFVDARDNKEWSTQKYELGNYTLPGLGFVRATSNDFIYHDETDAYLTFGYKYIQFTFGKFKNFWGPGHTGSLILSNYAASYDQFKLEVQYKKFKFTSIYAYLIDYQRYQSDSLQQRKYFAGHRLDVALWRWLSIGFSETVIFKGRSFEPAYLNPIMFYRSAEHYLGSPDNVMMGFDFNILPIKNVKCYGELLIDDIKTSKLGTNFYGNKLGVIAGIFFADALTIDNFDLRLEYVYLRPYLYSHYKKNKNYEHYDSSLGHWLPPNSDYLSIQGDYRYSKQSLFSCHVDWLRHGKNTAEKNVGGDIDFGFRGNIDNRNAKFLDGNLEKIFSVGINYSYEFFRNLYFRVHYNNIMFKDERLKVKSNEFMMSLGLNY